MEASGIDCAELALVFATADAYRESAYTGVLALFLPPG